MSVPTFHLQPGKRYIRRNGTITGHMEDISDGCVEDPLTGLIYSKVPDDDGHMIFFEPDQCDIMEEYDE